MDRRAAAFSVLVRVAFAFALLLASLSSPSPSWAEGQAQRREGGVAGAPLIAKLPTPVRFGEVVVPPGSYRVFVSEEAITFAEPQSMVTVAVVPGQVSTSETSAGSPTLKIVEQGTEIRITVQTLTDILTVVGARAAITPAQPDVEYASKRETVIDGGGGETSDATLVEGALTRYLKSIQHCGDSARRNHWRTDDPRFVRCVCPIVDKWRLPKLSTDVRVDRIIVKGQAGLSLTVGASGKARDCRVWVGGKPPPEPPAPAPVSPESSPGAGPTDSPAATPEGPPPAPPPTPARAAAAKPASTP